MAPTATSEVTASDICRIKNVPAWRVRWVVESRGIRPVRKVGNTNVFSRRDAERIFRELDGICERRALSTAKVRER